MYGNDYTQPVFCVRSVRISRNFSLLCRPGFYPKKIKENDLVSHRICCFQRKRTRSAAVNYAQCVTIRCAARRKLYGKQVGKMSVIFFAPLLRSFFLRSFFLFHIFLCNYSCIQQKNRRKTMNNFYDVVKNVRDFILAFGFICISGIVRYQCPISG